MRAPIPALLLLTGCPYVFGPADLSNVDRSAEPLETGTPAPTTPTASTGDTATPSTPTPTPTADTGVALPELSAGWIADHAGLVFLFDPADLFVGTTLTIRGAGGVVDVDIASPTSRVPFPLQDSCEPLQASFSLELRDAGGAPIAAGSVDVDLDGRGVVDIFGDEDIGVIGHGAAFCGRMSNEDDIDLTSFTMPAAGTWRFGVSWSNDSSIDARLYRSTVVLVSDITNDNPKVLVAPLDPEDYGLQLEHDNGVPADRWHVFVELVP